jgi:hypothetical protein
MAVPAVVTCLYGMNARLERLVPPSPLARSHFVLKPVCGRHAQTARDKSTRRGLKQSSRRWSGVGRPTNQVVVRAYPLRNPNTILGGCSSEMQLGYQMHGRFVRDIALRRQGLTPQGVMTKENLRADVAFVVPVRAAGPGWSTIRRVDGRAKHARSSPQRRGR